MILIKNTFIPDSFAILLHVSFLHLSKKNKLNISEFYRDSITFQTNTMHILTNFDRRTLVYYDGAGPDEYLSNSDSCIDNRSDLESDKYNNYESNYESDNEEATCVSTSITVIPSFQ